MHFNTTLSFDGRIHMFMFRMLIACLLSYRAAGLHSQARAQFSNQIETTIIKDKG